MIYTIIYTILVIWWMVWKNLFIISILIVIIISTFFFIKNKSTYKPEKVIVALNSMVTDKKSIKVTMETKKNYDIYYTLDGSILNKNSIKYKKSITLNKKIIKIVLLVEQFQDRH